MVVEVCNECRFVGPQIRFCFHPPFVLLINIIGYRTAKMGNTNFKIKLKYLTVSVSY